MHIPSELGVAETNSKLLGRVSVTTFVAVSGPLFLMVSVYVSWFPTVTGSGVSDLVIETSELSSPMS